LLSLELTGIWINEAREIPKTIVDACTMRVGRFPSMKDGGPTWYGVIADTNAPDEDHWWPIMAGESPIPDHISRDEALMLVKPDTWKFFNQPSGMVEERNSEGNLTGYHLNTKAENRNNLTPDYYSRIIEGKTKSWIDVYVMNKVGTLSDGKPVYSMFVEDVHVRPGHGGRLLGVQTQVGTSRWLGTGDQVLQLAGPGARVHVFHVGIATDVVREDAEAVVGVLVVRKAGGDAVVAHVFGQIQLRDRAGRLVANALAGGVRIRRRLAVGGLRIGAEGASALAAQAACLNEVLQGGIRIEGLAAHLGPRRCVGALRKAAEARASPRPGKSPESSWRPVWRGSRPARFCARRRATSAWLAPAN
ncbi:MAG: hypothetical protein EBW68_11120, partial [Actinobacteria bacterium]|nr:hypothetical protein [Actinomycetota bacterium]